MTNREKINRMSNKMLAEKILGQAHLNCDFCNYENNDNQCKHIGYIIGIVEWLESEVIE